MTIDNFTLQRSLMEITIEPLLLMWIDGGQREWKRRARRRVGRKLENVWASPDRDSLKNVWRESEEAKPHYNQKWWWWYIKMFSLISSLDGEEHAVSLHHQSFLFFQSSAVCRPWSKLEHRSIGRGRRQSSNQTFFSTRYSSMLACHDSNDSLNIAHTAAKNREKSSIHSHTLLWGLIKYWMMKYTLRSPQFSINSIIESQSNFNSIQEHYPNWNVKLLHIFHPMWRRGRFAEMWALCRARRREV